MNKSTRVSLEYGEVYSFFISKKERQGVYIGHNLNGMGRIASKRGEVPMIHSFNLEDTILRGNVLNVNGKFHSLSLTDREKSFALEILNKKSL